MDNDILRGLDWDESQGRLAYRDVRYLLIRPDTLAAFQKAAEAALGPPASDLLFAGGCAGGAASGKRYREALHLSDEEAVRFMCRMGGRIGWGRFEPVEIAPATGRLVVEVVGSPFAEAYGKSDAGVCHFIRGVLAGLAGALCGEDAGCVETACTAAGAPRCRFETARRS